MSLLKLRIQLSAIRHAIDELRSAIQDHSETIHATQEAERKHETVKKPISVLVAYDQQTKTDQKSQYGTQEAIATWTKRAVIAATIYAAIAALQWIELRRANGAANRALEAQTRPWVGIYGPPIVAKITNPQARSMNLTINFRNYGQSPAIIGANPPFLVTFGGGHGFWCDQYNKWADGEKQLNETGYGKYLDAIFPGNEGLTKDVQAPFVEGVTLDTFRLVLVGCITYESATKVRYHTEFTYQVTRREDGSIELRNTDTEPR